MKRDHMMGFPPVADPVARAERLSEWINEPSARRHDMRGLDDDGERTHYPLGVPTRVRDAWAAMCGVDPAKPQRMSKEYALQSDIAGIDKANGCCEPTAEERAKQWAEKVRSSDEYLLHTARQGVIGGIDMSRDNGAVAQQAAQVPCVPSPRRRTTAFDQLRDAAENRKRQEEAQQFALLVQQQQSPGLRDALSALNAYALQAFPNLC